VLRKKLRAQEVTGEAVDHIYHYKKGVGGEGEMEASGRERRKGGT